MRAGIIAALAILAAGSAAIAGRGRGDGRTRDDAGIGAPRLAGGVVDSAIPIEEATRRFQASVRDTPSALRGAASSRDELVRRFVRALATRDTAAFRSMVVSRAEFAFLVYPTSSLAHPPYELSPELAWLQLSSNSAKGYARVLERYGGRPLHLVGYRCARAPDRGGRNRVWRQCALRIRDPRGDALTLSLFGDILERDGRFKFVSYANKL